MLRVEGRELRAEGRGRMSEIGSGRSQFLPAFV